MVSGDRPSPPRATLAFAALLAATAIDALAALRVEVRCGGQPVESAVVTLTPIGRAATVVPIDAVMDQVGSEFTPRVLAVPRGSRVGFPNSDRIRHQVYSFSPAKRFDLPLYSGTPPEPVVFNNAGVVTVGCNIHDWMKGYIVVDTPHYALSDVDGGTTLEAPPGDYLLTAWHRAPACPAGRVPQPAA